MGLYNVIEPCVAGDVQYKRPTAEFQPVWVEDELAEALVAEGALSIYNPGTEQQGSDEHGGGNGDSQNSAGGESDGGDAESQESADKPRRARARAQQSGTDGS